MSTKIEREYDAAKEMEEKLSSVFLTLHWMIENNPTRCVRKEKLIKGWMDSIQSVRVEIDDYFQVHELCECR